MKKTGEILGCCFGYPGASEPIIDAALRTAFEGMHVSAPRLFPDSETFAGEWYLDSIVTKQVSAWKRCRPPIAAGTADTRVNSG